MKLKKTPIRRAKRPRVRKARRAEEPRGERPRGVRGKRKAGEPSCPSPRMHSQMSQMFIKNTNFKRYLDHRSRLLTTSTYLISILPKEVVKTLNIWSICTLRILLKHTQSKIELEDLIIRL